MSLYGAGTEGLGGAVDIVMPANIRDEIETIANHFAQLDQEIARALTDGQVLPSFVESWNEFAKEWQRFATNHSSWLDNIWYKSYQKALEYRRRLDEWRAKFEATSGRRISFPSPGSAPAPSMGNPFPSIPWRYLAYAGGAIGLLYGASRLVNSGVAAKREIVGARPLAAPATMVRNPPPWVIDSDVWEQAKLAVAPFSHRYENPEATLTHVYKQMGGRIG